MNDFEKLIEKYMWINWGVYKKIIHFKLKMINITCG